MMEPTVYHHSQPFELESGHILPGLDIAYHTFGKLNSSRDNVIWVCHALTANSNVFEWWPGLFGEGDLFNPEDHFIICANNLASCYGTTGPLSLNPVTGRKWYNDFPSVTIRDMAGTLQLLKEYLKIDSIHTLIGGSQGGQIAQEWSLHHPQLSRHLILLATNDIHSSWGIAFNESQRLAIKADATYGEARDDAGAAGLKAARSIALLSYRNYSTYELTQQSRRNLRGYKAPAEYQQYQGEKLVKRFNAYSYVRLSEAMDGHDVCRNKSCAPEEVFRVVSIPALIIGVESDLLFPVAEQKAIASALPNATYAEIESDFGHDGFLIETDQISAVIKRFYAQHDIKNYSKVLI